MDPLLQDFLIGAAGDFTGGLAAQFVSGLLRAAGRRVSEPFRTPGRTQALHTAVAAALGKALDNWAITDDEAVHYRDLFRDWLLQPVVLGEFRALFVPNENSQLDLDLLREEFEASGLSAEYLGTVSFEVLVQDMVGTFYQAAAEEPELQGPLQIGLLRQMANRMGALDRLVDLLTLGSGGWICWPSFSGRLSRSLMSRVIPTSYYSKSYRY
jgi:hypothetical protein